MIGLGICENRARQAQRTAPTLETLFTLGLAFVFLQNRFGSLATLQQQKNLSWPHFLKIAFQFIKLCCIHLVIFYYLK